LYGYTRYCGDKIWDKTFDFSNISVLLNLQKTCDTRFISQDLEVPSFGLLATLPAVAGWRHATFRFVGYPTCRGRMATRNPSLGLTHHTYNRLQAGCYRTMDLDFKERVF
jgi:hypothetical protein